ncbi:hypothetical protein [Gordonia otitidis]|uniref:Uncharacterized protein n=1 Tax=Gordonia otitidis (strain DSM 44809 / CCUG 52243 / JCM 12355 / NBRC 100426 / IFM 10032) TaxID=1108044 RepID=H5TRS0_GORO1|nr:hypothetical protein [Gordonia otitidis]GAB36178.1 hypothetical protein GOOTI_202_00340 [Gordonia otitidis NBRC 100426]
MWQVAAAVVLAALSVYSIAAAILMVWTAKPLAAVVFVCCAAALTTTALSALHEGAAHVAFWVAAALVSAVLTVGLWPVIAEHLVCPQLGHKPALGERITIGDDRSGNVQVGAYCTRCKERVGD